MVYTVKHLVFYYVGDLKLSRSLAASQHSKVLTFDPFLALAFPDLSIDNQVAFGCAKQAACKSFRLG